MDSKTHRTAGEQKFWDETFHDVFPDCLKQLEMKGVLGCAQIAREAADAALNERRNSQKGISA